MNNKKNLGKGLEALISEINESDEQDDIINENNDSAHDNENTNNYFTLSIDLIEPGKYQPRKNFDEENLNELAQSIKSNGLIQPIIVTVMNANGKHNIIAGERRWRAAKIAGLTTIDAIIRDIPDKNASELALIENVQRKDLNYIEEADGYKKLIDDYNYTQEELSKIIGKSRTYITNILRLLQLPDIVKQYLIDAKITMGHARALIGVENSEKIVEHIIMKGLNVRQTEQLVKNNNSNSNGNNKFATSNLKSNTVKRDNSNNQQEQDEDIKQLENMISEKLMIIMKSAV